MKSLWPLIAVGLGVFLLALGFLWTLIFPATRSWTEEKSQRMIELQNNAHRLLFVADKAKTRPTPDGPSPREAQANFEAAMSELAALRKEFEAVRDRPQNVGIYLRWAGSACALLGGIAVMVGRGG